MIRGRGGYTLLELIVVIAIISILGAIGISNLELNRDRVEKTGMRLALDIESYGVMAVYTPYTYSISFRENGYTVNRIGNAGENTVKRVVYPDGIEFGKIPNTVYFLKRGEMIVRQEDMTIKLVDSKNRQSIYITVVPVSNRVMLTDSPSNPF